MSIVRAMVEMKFAIECRGQLRLKAFRMSVEQYEALVQELGPCIRYVGARRGGLPFLGVPIQIIPSKKGATA